MGTAALTIPDIQAIVGSVAARHPVRRVTLFGSHARGEAHAGSDVDLHAAMDYAPTMSGFATGELYSDLCDAFGFAIDLVTKPLELMDRGADKVLASQIARDGVVVYER